MMQERPILMSAPMVRAILEGRKTQTRRAIKLPRGMSEPLEMDEYDKPVAVFDVSGCMGEVRCPYGKVGDRLWVRETTLDVEAHGYKGPVYLASEQGEAVLEGGLGSPDDYTDVEARHIKLRPSIFMPRTYARLILEVTDIRVQELQDTSEADVQAEGCTGSPLGPAGDHILFPTLWDQINGEGAWGKNPLVWAITFKRLAALEAGA